MRYLVPVIPLLATIGIVSAQVPTPPTTDGPLPTFEVASVKANKAPQSRR